MEKELDGLCREKRMFYRVISGLHSSISTHLCYEYYYKIDDDGKGVWKANVECYKDRVGNHKDRLNNLYYL